jgi:hypothetical protein
MFWGQTDKRRIPLLLHGLAYGTIIIDLWEDNI